MALLLVQLLAQSAWAQSTPAPTAAAASAPNAPTAPSERAKRDADKVFQMILLHSDKKPNAKPAGKDSAVAAPAPVSPSRAAPTAAAAPVQNKAAPAATAAVVAVKAAATELAAQPVTTPVPAAEPALPAPAVAVPKPDLAVPLLPMPTAAVPNGSSKLELLTSVEPDFPNRLVRTLGAGQVVVQFDVAADGSVMQADVVQSSHRGLESAAINAVKQWKFKPMPGPANGVTELKFE